jgi:hypothetical protein
MGMRSQCNLDDICEGSVCVCMCMYLCVCAHVCVCVQTGVSCLLSVLGFERSDYPFARHSLLLPYFVLPVLKTNQ